LPLIAHALTIIALSQKRVNQSAARYSESAL
jgi:hypothetical protein